MILTPELQWPNWCQMTFIALLMRCWGRGGKHPQWGPTPWSSSWFLKISRLLCNMAGAVLIDINRSLYTVTYEPVIVARTQLNILSPLFSGENNQAMASCLVSLHPPSNGWNDQKYNPFRRVMWWMQQGLGDCWRRESMNWWPVLFLISRSSLKIMT